MILGGFFLDNLLYGSLPKSPKNSMRMRNMTKMKLERPIIMKGMALPISNNVPPNLKQIDLPINPQNAKNPAITPLTSFGMFFEKYPSKLTP